MRLGATIPLEYAVKYNYSVTDMPIEDDMEDKDLIELRNSFENANVVGVQTSKYCNLISVDDNYRKNNISQVRETLRMASLAGCKSLVVGGGHRDPDNYQEVFAAHKDNWSDEALDLLAESCLEILDNIDIKDTKLIVETWVMTPLNTPERIKKLVEKVNHKKFGILFDPVNLMNLDRYYTNGDFIKKCIDVFGESIEVVHAKDSLLKPYPHTYHMAEAPIGQGNIDYETLLKSLNQLPIDIPILMEHLKKPEDYHSSGIYLQRIANELGIELL